MFQLRQKKITRTTRKLLEKNPHTNSIVTKTRTLKQVLSVNITKRSSHFWHGKQTGRGRASLVLFRRRSILLLHRLVLRLRKTTTYSSQHKDTLHRDTSRFLVRSWVPTSATSSYVRHDWCRTRSKTFGDRSCGICRGVHVFRLAHDTNKSVRSLGTLFSNARDSTISRLISRWWIQRATSNTASARLLQRCNRTSLHENSEPARRVCSWCD